MNNIMCSECFDVLKSIITNKRECGHYDTTGYPALNPGMRIAQIVLVKMDCVPDEPYNGKYQGQKGATPSRIHMDTNKEDKDLKQRVEDKFLVPRKEPFDEQ